MLIKFFISEARPGSQLKTIGVGRKDFCLILIFLTASVYWIFNGESLVYPNLNALKAFLSIVGSCKGKLHLAVFQFDEENTSGQDEDFYFKLKLYTFLIILGLFLGKGENWT